MTFSNSSAPEPSPSTVHAGSRQGALQVLAFALMAVHLVVLSLTVSTRLSALEEAAAARAQLDLEVAAHSQALKKSYDRLNDALRQLAEHPQQPVDGSHSQGLNCRTCDPDTKETA